MGVNMNKFVLVYEKIALLHRSEVCGVALPKT